ncbi:TPA: hypothetical protein DCZ15_03630 [Candidatus Falkowbacteria bacterium]|nr:MAG: hypothetical protein UV95_C0005G0012 [Candidatus Falkowbacteria bacterium GW2011_GWF2_43_32]HBA36935.1 hypothetical protein [Candidatus Falkowbacteria bacterium]
MSTAKNATISGIIEGFIVGAMQSVGKVAEQHGQEFLKSKVFGIGTNDEHLFEAAKATAVHYFGVDIKDIVRINKVVSSYGWSVRGKIVRTIGRNEETMQVDSKPSGSKEGAKDKKVSDAKNEAKDKKVSDVQKSSITSNIEGARILAMWAKMTDDEIRESIAASGMADTIVAKLEVLGENLTKAIEKGEAVKDAESFFEKKTWLEKLADTVENKRREK